MQTNHRRVEAVLFAVGKEITLERLSSLTNLEQKEVEKILKDLTKSYQESDNALQLVKKQEGYKLTVLDEFIPLVSSIVESTELERPLMETLAVIAWRYPVLQSEVIKLRSPAAYDHMRSLQEQGFIAKERSGRTYKVKLTKKFFNYFDLPSQEAKKAFLSQIPQEVLQEANEVSKEADEVERLLVQEEKDAKAREEIEQAMDQVEGQNTPQEESE